MFRKLVTISALAVLILALVAFPASSNGQALADLSWEILEKLQSFYPVQATEMGIHSYDHRLADYSSNSVKQMIKDLTDYEKKLYKFQKTKLSEHDRINLRLVKSNVDIALLNLKQIAWHKKCPQVYVDEAIDGVNYLMLSQHAPLSERVVSVISRMKAVPALLATARRNLKNPPKVYIDAAAGPLESGIQFYKDVAGELMQKFPERADEILRVSTQARESMNDFLTYLSEMTPGPETAFAIGKDNFDYKLKHEYFLDYDSDSLLKIGETLLAEAQAAYREYEENVETNHQNGQDSIFVPSVFTKQDILDYYNWEVRQIRIFLEENDVVTVPETVAPVTVVETPSFLRSMIAGVAYQPAGPFDTVQNAYFYVRPIPDDLDRVQLEARFRYVHRRGFKGSVVHEAFPGHHLQLQLAGMNSDPIRKWQYNRMMSEGWALYCEEMMYHAGLFGDEDPVTWLGILGGIRFRAARIVADVKLHTGQFTYQECVDWMIETLDVSSESGKRYMETEVQWYTLRPTVPMTYLIGKTEIMNLRAAAMDRDGEDFSERQFHDALLAEGSIPPILIWETMGLVRDI
ncbi:MAG: DUF885 domain-containing protein [candidate division Zixibacteria bacterium]|nr:DUF885 domain-containing protein [candidate division Zixibacteria bacterium]